MSSNLMRGSTTFEIDLLSSNLIRGSTTFAID
jgi:hypothetical protein